MSLAKRMLEEIEARGWESPGDKFVCADCVDDYALKDHIAANLASETCDYCDNTSEDAMNRPGFDGGIHR